MIFEGSRYEEAALVKLPIEGAAVPTIFPKNPYTYSFEFQEYRVQEGDRLDHLAQQFYGDPNQWWQIMTANPEILYPELPSGTIIRIPHASSLR